MSSDPREARRTIANPEGAPPPVGPYSPGVEVGGWIFLSGQIALSEEGEIIPGGALAETRLIFDRIRRMLHQAGGRLEDIVKMTLYLTNLSDFQTVNQICTEFFTPPYPARVTVEVSGLPKGANVEVDVIAVKRG